jgi:hypothetical protein
MRRPRSDDRTTREPAARPAPCGTEKAGRTERRVRRRFSAADLLHASSRFALAAAVSAVRQGVRACGRRPAGRRRAAASPRPRPGLRRRQSPPWCGHLSHEGLGEVAGVAVVRMQKAAAGAGLFLDDQCSRHCPAPDRWAMRCSWHQRRADGDPVAPAEWQGWRPRHQHISPALLGAPSSHRCIRGWPCQHSAAREGHHVLGAVNARSRAASTWIWVVGNTGTGLSCWLMSSSISVQPKMIPWAPSSTRRPMKSR